MTYMNNAVDFAVSGGIQELNMGEVELVGGALTYQDLEMMGWFLTESGKKFLTNPSAGVASFYLDIKWFITKL